MQILVHVKPGSKIGPRVMTDDKNITVYVRERAIDGKANDAVIKTVADYYDVAKSRVKLLKGKTSKFKTIIIDGLE